MAGHHQASQPHAQPLLCIKHCLSLQDTALFLQLRREAALFILPLPTPGMINYRVCLGVHKTARVPPLWARMNVGKER